MRLTESQRTTIQRIVREYAKEETAQVWLFGSRVDDTEIGGDIDLLVETQQPLSIAAELALTAKLEHILGTPVDVITTSGQQRKTPIVNIAKMTGVSL